MSDFDAAAITDHPLVLHAAIFSARAFPVLLRSKNPFAKKTVLLGTIGAVIDRLRLFDLSKGPTTNIVRPGQADLDGRVIVDAIICAFADAHVPKLLCSEVRTIAN